MTAKFNQLTDAQWDLIQSLMNWKAPLERGTPRTNLRMVWNSILYILSWGSRWVDIPKNDSIYASKSTAHRWLVRWQNDGVFDRVMSGLVQKALKEGKIDPSRLMADGSFSPCTRGRGRGRPRLQGEGSIATSLGRR